MTVKYKTVITKAGAIRLAAATLPEGKKVNFTAMAVGDGGGTLPTPDPNQTNLVKEVWRHALNKISQDRKNKNYVVAELLIPPETGGFWMRELGLYDDTGTLIAVGNMAESYKPALAEGSGRAQTVRMVIMVSDIESVELTIDTSTVMATQDYVDDRLAEHEQSRRHPDATLTAKGFTQLSSATDSASESVAATPKAVKAAYDLAKGKYTVQDATTAQKGIVQLSSATDSASETLAATPKAVKAAYDLAKGKYTAQDATTAQKGIVQLSSATDSTSEALAATPKAVKAANDNANGRVPSGRKVNGRALSNDINITAQDIFNGQAVGIGNAEDLNAYTTPGLYYQPANAQAQTGRNYPEANAGSLEVYKHAGITQIYRVYNNSRSYIRTLYSGVWTAWTKQYDAANKPSPADINAVNKSGDTMTGILKVNAEVQSAYANGFRIAYGDYGTFWRNDGNNLYLMLTNKGDAYGTYNAIRPLRVSLATGALQSDTPLSVINTIDATKEITAGYSGAFAFAEQYRTKAPFFNSYSTTGGSEYHPLIKQQATITGKNSWAFSMGALVGGDALSWHLHMKGSGSGDINYKWDTDGNFSAPGQLIPGNFANFDYRYYTKTQTDAGYMPKTGAYTKSESDGRFQPKGNYTPAGQAYTKAESDARYQLKNSVSKTANGRLIDTSTGLIYQWGRVSSSVTGNINITFPYAFPSACVSLQSTLVRGNNDGGQNCWAYVTSVSTTGASVGSDKYGVFWFAVGY
ncbi:phage tail-collar fiber domain-containing protein [Enterobacter ludwigii]